MKVIAVYSISNVFGIALYEYNGEIALAAAYNSDSIDTPRTHKVYYNHRGRGYIRMMGGRQYLDEFVRV